MKETILKDRVMKIGDKLAIILSKNNGNIELYALTKELYILTNDFIEIIGEKEEVNGNFKEEKDWDKTFNTIEKNCKLLNKEQREIKLSLDNLLKIVSEHDRVLKPISDLVRKHTELIDSIKEKVFYAKGGKNE